MSSRPRFVVSPHRRGLIKSVNRSNGRRSIAKGPKKFGGIGFGGGSFRSNNLFASRDPMSAADASVQRGNIKVCVRVRRANPSEIGPARRLIVQAVDEQLIIFDPKEESEDFYFHGEKQRNGRDLLKRQNKDKKFIFDNVYGPNSTNKEIFDNTIKPTIDTILSGCNCSVFAYGATGSGKTYTMLGSAGNPGITFLTVMELYRRLTAMDEEYETEIQVSYVEVYNEEVKDLLAGSKILGVREDAYGGTVIPNLTFHKPTDSQELFDLLSHGNSIRSQHPTDLNAESSRSHAIFQVHVKLRGRFTDMMNNCKSAKLVMVDLAGSERGTATGFKGKRFREGASINKSLLALGNCITALADGKKHVPYRDSKLTRILKDALGGNCKTVMIANVSPADTSYNETFNTLKYADRAKRIQFHIKKNVVTVHARIAQYGQVVEEMSTQIANLKKLLEEKTSSCKCGVDKHDAETETEKLEECRQKSTPTPPPNLNRTFEKESVGNISIEESVDGKIDQSNSKNPVGHAELLQQKTTVEPKRSPYTPRSLPPEAPVFESEFLGYDSMYTERTRLEIKRAELNLKASESAIKVKCKKKRYSCALNLQNKDLNAEKGLDRMKKQVDLQKEKCLSLTKQVMDANRELDVTLTAIDKMEALFKPLLESPIKITVKTYLEYKSLLNEKESNSKANLDGYHVRIQTYLMEELSRTEGLLGKAMVLLKPIHHLLKHHGHTTKENEEDYKSLMSEYFGNRIHFADGKENSPVAPTTPLHLHLRMISTPPKVDLNQTHTCNTIPLSPVSSTTQQGSKGLGGTPRKENFNVSYTVQKYEDD